MAFELKEWSAKITVKRGSEAIRKEQGCVRVTAASEDGRKPVSLSVLGFFSAEQAGL